MNAKEIRKLLGLTQEEFAHRLGVCVAAVQRWERAIKPVKPSRLAQERINQLLEKHESSRTA